MPRVRRRGARAVVVPDDGQLHAELAQLRHLQARHQPGQLPHAGHGRQAKVGMTEVQVQQALGTPMLADPFHADRWDYIYRYTRQDKLVESREFRVYFVDNKLARWEGDEVPRSAAELNRIAAERSLGQPPADDRSWWDKFIGIFHRND